MSPHECGLATPWLMVKVGGSGNSQGFTLGYIGIAPSGAQAILCARQSLTAINLDTGDALPEPNRFTARRLPVLPETRCKCSRRVGSPHCGNWWYCSWEHIPSRHLEPSGQRPSVALADRAQETTRSSSYQSNPDTTPKHCRTYP